MAQVNLTEDGTAQWSSSSLAMRCLDFLNLYYVLLLILVGVFGNFFSFLVFTTTDMKLRSSSRYLAALAVSDLGFLITMLVLWFKNVGIDLFNRHGWCQVLVYANSVCSSLSVWLTVAFTAERLIVVQYPLKAKLICTARRAKTATLTVAIVILGAHLTSPLSSIIMPNSFDNFTCDLSPDYYKFMITVYSLDTVLTLIIPLVLIVAMNILIIRKVVNFSRKIRNFDQPSFDFPNIQVKNLYFNLISLKTIYFSTIGV